MKIAIKFKYFRHSSKSYLAATRMLMKLTKPKYLLSVPVTKNCMKLTCLDQVTLSAYGCSKFEDTSDSDLTAKHLKMKIC